MKPKYFSKALLVNSLGNFKAQISDTLSLFMTRPEQGTWTTVSKPARDGDGYQIFLVFTSSDSLHSVRASFNLTQKTLDVILEKLYEIDGLDEWRLCCKK